MRYYKFLAILLIIICLSGLIFQIKAEAAGPILKLDEEVRRLVQKTDSSWVYSTMSSITRTGSSDLLLQAMAFIPNTELKNDAFLGFLASHAVSETVKLITGKTRPRTGEREYKPFSGNKSFPSGHAAGTFAVATAISKHYPRYRRYAYAWSTLVAISRLYEDAHWFSDVVVGSAIGHYTTRWTIKTFEW